MVLGRWRPKNHQNTSCIQKRINKETKRSYEGYVDIKTCGTIVLLHMCIKCYMQAHYVFFQGVSLEGSHQELKYGQSCHERMSTNSEDAMIAKGLHYK